MRYLVMPGYFDNVYGLREEDEIAVIAFGDDPVTHALLVVDEIRKDQVDKVIVKQMVNYSRRAA